jgi:DNA polymerase-3 subunit epsilon
MRFVSIDVETANARMRSICQIGLVVYEDGREIGAESLLINPGEEFDPVNVGIHGIDAQQVADALTFREIGHWLSRNAGGQTLVCHTHFDRTAITQATAYHALPPMDCRWLDSAMVARRAWPQFAQSGYGLSNLAREFGFSFRHHDALEDARTAGLILIRAIEESRVDIDQWIARCKLGLSGQASGRERRNGDGDGPLLGETMVFTGALSMPRREAADLAHIAGGRVEPGVTKETTILVVGDQDLDRLGGALKSSKHRKAQQLDTAGQPIRFLAESDFMAIVSG